ncbi:hypothetical protein J3R82DRAFT_8216 [Butyriboletus roseoflavus]|nr:hypothetical protein J3R82DRAFT_8216 [Butyriboletus roseoflavus]
MIECPMSRISEKIKKTKQAGSPHVMTGADFEFDAAPDLVEYVRTSPPSSTVIDGPPLCSFQRRILRAVKVCRDLRDTRSLGFNQILATFQSASRSRRTQTLGIVFPFKFTLWLIQKPESRTRTIRSTESERPNQSPVSPPVEHDIGVPIPTEPSMPDRSLTGSTSRFQPQRLPVLPKVSVAPSRSDSHEDGLDVAINDLLDALSNEISAKGRRSCVVCADVSVEAQVKNMVDTVLEALGGLDVVRNFFLFTSAYGLVGPLLQPTRAIFLDGGQREHIQDGEFVRKWVVAEPVVHRCAKPCLLQWTRFASVDHWDTTFNVNAKGPFLCYKYAVAQMIIQGRGGRIIGPSSRNGKRGVLCPDSEWLQTTLVHPGMPDGIAYSSTKFAIRRLTQAASEFRIFHPPWVLINSTTAPLSKHWS